MFRKTILALAAIAALGTTAFAPTTASAGHRHHHFARHHGWGFFGPALLAGALVGGVAIAAGASCYERQWVETPYGLRKVRVYVC